MMKKTLFLVSLFLSTCFASSAADQEALADHIEYFYVDPSSARGEKVIADMAHLNKLEDWFFFVAALSRQHPRHIMNWMTRSGINFEKHPRMIHALQFGGLNEEAVHLAQKAKWPANKLMSARAIIPSFLKAPISTPGYISCMCAHFFATGDARYIRKVIDVFEAVNPDASLLTQLQTEAREKLPPLVFHHDRIYRLCLEEMQTRTGPAKAVAKELIDEAHKSHNARSFPAQNGMFTAQLLVTDDMNFEQEWDSLPALEAPVCKSVSSIPFPKENKEIKVFLLMDGFELSKDLDADVTYDVEITDPNGELMGKCDNLLGLKRKLPNRFFLQKADQPVGFKFSMEDKEGDKGIPSGVYTVKATVKDRISGKDLKLCSTLEVLPEKP